MTILKALKDRIRSMGGETNATNIADAIKDLPKGGSSELPPEVSNAVETHGMGWTSEEEVPAINITWDGNIEGLEKTPGEGSFYRLYNEPLSKEQISGAYCEYVYVDTTYEGVLEDNEEISSDGFSSYNLIYDDGKLTQVIMVIEEDVEYESITFHKGVYFSRPADNIYISKLLVEASTVETVHQIDEKYIPSSGGTITYEFNLIAADGEDELIVRTEANPATVKEHLENGDNVRFIIKFFVSEESLEDYHSLMTTNNINIGDVGEVNCVVDLGSLIGKTVDGESHWSFELG